MNNYLSKVERDLVVKHVVDEKPLIILKPLTNKYLPNEEPTYQFPQITIEPKSYQVVEKGILFFPFAEFSFSIPHGTSLAVLFHFKGRALIFESQFSHLTNGYALVISPYVFKQMDDSLPQEKKIRGTFYFGLQDEKSLSVPFSASATVPLFSTDMWKDFSPASEKKFISLAKNLFDRKVGVSGLFTGLDEEEKKRYYPLLSAALYLTQKNEPHTESFVGRARPLELLFLSDTHIVFASESIKEIMHEKSEYFVTIQIPVLRLTRTINCTLFVESILFDTIDGKKCEIAFCNITSMQEENRRFLRERLYGKETSF